MRKWQWDAVDSGRNWAVSCNFNLHSRCTELSETHPFPWTIFEKVVQRLLENLQFLERYRDWKLQIHIEPSVRRQCRVDDPWVRQRSIVQSRSSARKIVDDFCGKEINVLHNPGDGVESEHCVGSCAPVVLINPTHQNADPVAGVVSFTLERAIPSPIWNGRRTKMNSKPCKPRQIG